MPNISDKPFTAFLEELLKHIYSDDKVVQSIASAVLFEDGTCATSFYNSDATDLAIMIHNLEMDKVESYLLANKDYLRELLAEDDEKDGDSDG